MISKILSLVLVSVIACAGRMAFAQQAPDRTKTPATSSSTAAASTAEPADAEAAATAAVIAKANAAAAAAAAHAPTKTTDEATFTKMAKKAGWHTEAKDGITLYCRESTDVGTRFSTKKCATPTQLAVILEQQEFARDQLKQRGCGGNCGEH